MTGKKVNKKEIARFKALADLGETPYSIAKRTGREKHTVKKYLDFLKSGAYVDPTIDTLVEQIKQHELQDLYLLGARGRQRLHELLDRGDAPMIPTIALVDRVFQQRRLLSGESTANVSQLTEIISSIHKNRPRHIVGGSKSEDRSDDTKPPHG